MSEKTVDDKTTKKAPEPGKKLEAHMVEDEDEFEEFPVQGTCSHYVS